MTCECHRETGSHELCCGHDEGRNPDCPIHGDAFARSVQYRERYGLHMTYDDAIAAYEEAKAKADAAYQEFLYLEAKALDLLTEAERAAAREAEAFA